MHELAICQALMSQVEAIARSNAARVSEVRIGIGPLSGVEPELIAQAYPLVCAGTVAEGSRLAIESTAVRVRCRDCGAETTAAPNRLLCGSCAAWRTDIISGDEMLLLRVELQLPETSQGPAHV
jgi:hydrogenase nickel incorporation protein HypA/HybF